MLLLLPTLLWMLLLTKESFCTVRSWGELCNHTAECDDHRMVCKATYFNYSMCLCDRFHEWRGAEVGCYQIVQTQRIMNMSITSSDSLGKLARDQEAIFLGHKIAGFFVMTVGVLVPFVVAIYCCHMRKKDRMLKREILCEKKEQLKNSYMSA
ncbi:PREDICTED: uncharacterized protein LOC108561006 [Nicrophorus vespilloides]|uniref:Uncharacterized protein LOC108561006 n=1 Tax=Nicrophorus vespilloides TaxID=110193 RepID=A0ABM1MI49_NICVS|nr:PREDICTED: uncharacterized protein LOC108561006 [Nicrophorus vespilloides]